MHNDVTICKIPTSAINHINRIAKKQKAMKVLKFGDRTNIIDRTISTLVDYTPETIIISANTSDLEWLVQHNVLTELDCININDTDDNHIEDAEYSFDESAATN